MSVCDLGSLSVCYQVMPMIRDRSAVWVGCDFELGWSARVGSCHGMMLHPEPRTLNHKRHDVVA